MPVPPSQQKEAKPCLSSKPPEHSITFASLLFFIYKQTFKMGIDTTDAVDNSDTTYAPLSLPFPPFTTSHILACSYHSWYPHFRSHSPKARLVPLSQPFLDYLRADGIVLPPDDQLNDDDSGFSEANNDSASNSNSDSGSDTDDDGQDTDPSEAWPEIHSAIRSTISSLGGSVLPKLNWSAPKDATWMSPTNDMACRTANDIYLLLKSSDFIIHDLEHAFDDCVDVTTTTNNNNNNNNNSIIPYHLILRKKFEINPALEFRCFVRNRHLIAISPRDMNHFDFLFDLAPRFKSLITTFLHDVILPKFHEPSFVLDVYISPQTQSRKERVWLIDLNPWAQHTDPLLFSWLELLTMPGPDTDAQVEAEESESESEGGEEKEVIRLCLKPVSDTNTDPHQDAETDATAPPPPPLIFDPELRLVHRDDPEAYAFASAKYSAHKLPKDVVDASMTPSAMIRMMEEWRRVMHGRPDEAEDSG
ncbi:hypothetical protein DV736_g2343, partial [Chaetothyriales sp. CBS 134916]